LSIVVLSLLEITYRYYLVDFYKPELKNLSTKPILSEDTCKILVLGDSFSAITLGYLNIVQDSLNECKIYNSSISGTTVYHANLIAKKRINDINPDLVIYQVYVGNDLLELNHGLINSGKTPLARKFYWWLSDRIKVLGFINYRMRGLSKYFYNDMETNVPLVNEDDFSPNLYSEREKLYFDINPKYIDQYVNLHPSTKKVQDHYFKIFEELIGKISSNRKAIVLLIPHCSQVAPSYRENMKKLGAQFASDSTIALPGYAFALEVEERLMDKNVSMINLLPYFQKEINRDSLYYPNDPHLSYSGQKVLASILIDQLKKR
jgi:hypothetical protein